MTKDQRGLWNRAQNMPKLVMRKLRCGRGGGRRGRMRFDEFFHLLDELVTLTRARKVCDGESDETILHVAIKLALRCDADHLNCTSDEFVFTLELNLFLSTRGSGGRITGCTRFTREKTRGGGGRGGRGGGRGRGRRRCISGRCVITFLFLFFVREFICEEFAVPLRIEVLIDLSA